jgi:hypothetical protein
VSEACALLDQDESSTGMKALAKVMKVWVLFNSVTTIAHVCGLTRSASLELRLSCSSLVARGTPHWGRVKTSVVLGLIVLKLLQELNLTREAGVPGRSWAAVPAVPAPPLPAAHLPCIDGDVGAQGHTGPTAGT